MTETTRSFLTRHRFPLADGERMTIRNLPAGTKVTAAEEDCAREGYQTTVSLTSVDSGEEPETLSQREITVNLQSVDVALLFTNRRDAAVPTGLPDTASTVPALAFLFALLFLRAMRAKGEVLSGRHLARHG